MINNRMDTFHTNRFAVYVYWDPHGVLRDYAFYFVKELKKNCNRVVFIANGFLTFQSKQTLLNEGIEVYTRENLGYDFYAYKFGLDILLPYLHECDELILSNSSIYGPFIPFKKIFKKMNEVDSDFWGISAWKGIPWPTHIQSYFLVFRNTILTSKCFSEYWKNLPTIKNRREAIEKCEVKLTNYLSDFGYSWSVYTEDSEDGDYSITRAQKSLKSGMPFLKRKYFEDLNIEYAEKISTVNLVRSLYSYDVNMFYSDFFLTNLQKPKKVLNLNNLKILIKKYFPSLVKFVKQCRAKNCKPTQLYNHKINVKIKKQK